MQRAVEVTAGDVEYTVTMFPAFKGLTYLQKLLKIVGPAVGEIFSNAIGEGEGISDISVDDEALSFAIRELTTNFDKENVAQLVQDMIKDGVTKGGQQITFNQEFSGNYGALMKLIGTIVKENYQSFFGEGGFAELQKLIPQQPSKSE